MTLVGAAAGLPAGAIMVLPAEVLRPQNRAAGMGIFLHVVLRRDGAADTGRGYSPRRHRRARRALALCRRPEFAAVAVLALLRLSQRRYRTLS